MGEKCNSALKKFLIEHWRKNEYRNNNFHVFSRITLTIYICGAKKKRKKERDETQSFVDPEEMSRKR